jgi:ribosome-binding ATPase
VAGKIDPASDIEVINTELALADLDSVERAYQKALKAAKTGDKDASNPRDLLERVRKQLNEAKPVRCWAWMPMSICCCATCICSPTSR